MAPATSSSPFFDKLPAEIRNGIYELTFTPGDCAGDLLNVKPPSKNILLTCRQAYQEASQIHKMAHRRYWTETEFFVYERLWNRDDRNRKTTHLANLTSKHSRDLNYINHITITRFFNTAAERVIYELVDRRGGWTQVVWVGETPFYRFYIINSLTSPAHEYSTKEALEAALETETSYIPLMAQLELMHEL